jgi:hypothetical protein
MKSEIKTQYLTLQLKITQMLHLLQENEGTIKELKKQISSLNQDVLNKNSELNSSREKIKELEKSIKISDKITKIVVNTNDTAVPTAELKKKLDNYIAIIDQSIEILRNK